MPSFTFTTPTLQFPTLPEGLVWQLDRHLNLAVGRVCSIYIKKFTTKKVLGITFKLSKTYGYRVVFDDIKSINDEMAAMVRELS